MTLLKGVCLGIFLVLFVYVWSYFGASHEILIATGLFGVCLLAKQVEQLRDKVDYLERDLRRLRRETGNP